MKKKFLTVLAALLVITSSSLVFTSCEKDPVVPDNENEHKDHDEPAKAELILAEGHLHGKYKFHQNPDREGVKYYKMVQKITYTLTDKGWKPTENSPKRFAVLGAMQDVTNGYAVYGLWINYYDAHGKLINGEFVENGQDQIHQHFFIPRNIEPTFDGIAEADDDKPGEMFDYIYCDTNPWNKTMHSKEGKLTGDKNPIGFKGYFKFNKTRKKFNLSIELMHAAKSKFENGKTSPYYQPSRKQIQVNHWDLKIKVPVVVYRNQSEYIESDSDVPLDKLPKNDLKVVKATAKAYGITEQQALDDLNALFYGDVDPESGTLWF